MGKTVRFTFRLTDQEAERMRHNSQMRGYTAASEFIRTAVLDRDLWLEKKLNEILLIIKEVEKKVKD